MKQLKSSLSHLRHLFARAITIRDISESFVSFDSGQKVGEVRKFMEGHGYDIVGIREHGLVAGYADLAEIRNQEDLNIIGTYRRDFKTDEVMLDSEPVLSAFKVLQSDRRYVLVNILGRVGGIVTRGDLQKAPVRLWLFGLVSLTEMQMLRLVRDRYPGDSWSTLQVLSPARVKMAQELFEQRRKRQEEISLSDCLQLADKATIITKDSTLLNLLNFKSKRLADEFFADLCSLRDKLAHSNDIMGAKWAELGGVVHLLEITLEILEHTTSVPRAKNDFQP